MPLLSIKSFLSLKFNPHYPPNLHFLHFFNSKFNSSLLTSPHLQLNLPPSPLPPSSPRSNIFPIPPNSHPLCLLLLPPRPPSLLRRSSARLPRPMAEPRGLLRRSRGQDEPFPPHVWEAIVAYEDRRFSSHFGFDPVGVARAAVSFSACGGGSTITQQLVKNTFLKNEKTIPRKMVEMVLSVALERTISKRRILSCYVNKIYWGHGIYGIESASFFYFGKHPSLLTLGESALLAGLIPAPEFRSPFRDPTRGKTFQARVLKRMVDVGFLDIETALSVVKQPLYYIDGPAFVNGLCHLSAFLREEIRGSRMLKRGSRDSTSRGEWDWETESKIWETCEEMERWAIRIRHRPPRCL